MADKPNDLGPNDFGHVPVMLQRCVELLTPALTRHHSDGSGAVLVDATLGAGGHAERFLTELPGLRLLGLDQRVIDHDVEGMEHHISPATLRAIEALTEQLRRRPAFVAKLQGTKA